MKKNSVTVSLTINNYFSDGSAIGIARIELSYKKESITFVNKDVVNAHCTQLINKIIDHNTVFKQLSGCELSCEKNSGFRGNLYFSGEHTQQPDRLADAIGEFWCKQITGGMGGYSKFDAEPLHHVPFEALNQAQEKYRKNLIALDQGSQQLIKV
jgi:hypothetical protein